MSELLLALVIAVIAWAAFGTSAKRDCDRTGKTELGGVVYVCTKENT